MDAPSSEKMARVLLRVERAKEHFRNLEVEIARFLDGNNPRPYEISVDRDPDTRKLIYRVASVRDVPDIISILTGDVLQNCRTALDHLAYQFFLVGSPGQPTTTRISFPIFDSAASYESEKARKVQGMRQDAVEFINAVQPYKGGDGVGKILWPLHSLNNLDKHRLLVAVASSNQGRSPTEDERRTALGQGHSDEFYIFPGKDNWNAPLQPGYVFHVGASDSEVDQNVKLRLEITLAEPAIIERESLLETLQKIVRLVEGIVRSCGVLLA